mgnify:CR=1 FL=1
MSVKYSAIFARLRGAIARGLGLLLVRAGAPGWIWASLMQFGGGKVGEGIFDCLGGRDPVAERARQYFAAASAEVLPLLMAVARDHPSWEVRLGAFTALLWRKEPEALRFLAGLLRDRSWYTKGLAPGEAEEAPAWPKLLGL